MSNFKITLENKIGEIVSTESFNERKEAKKAERRIKKDHGLYNHAGHVVNYEAKDEEVFEMFTNY